jgi:superfamily I DNA/RNA helicase
MSATPRWSEQQEAIFTHAAKSPRNLAVRARAGTGKTTTIIEAAKRAHEGTNILLAAFNKRIATELNAKLSFGGAVAKTLHSVGFDFVRRNWSKVRVDDDRKFRLARQAWAQWKRASGDRTPQHILHDNAPDPVIAAIVKLASLAKNTIPRGTVDDFVEAALSANILPENGWADEIDVDTFATLAASAVLLATQRDGTLDFDDMVFLPVYHRWVRPTYALVIIDEAQDMNATQLLLAQGCAAGRIMVVGDDRQAIYGFRGADSNAIDRLIRELDAVELPLTVTYRCPKNVVTLAQSLVPDYTAAVTAPDGTVAHCDTTRMMNEATPSDFILSRTNAPLARTALALLRQGKRARIEGRDISKSLLSTVKRLKATTIPEMITKLDTWATRERDKVIARKSLSADTKQARLDYLDDMVSTITVMTDGLAEVAELETRINELFAETGAPSIVCSTVHKAKGLEADRVWVLTDTLYCNGKRQSIEETNIHYVAVTRAKDTLMLVREG